MQLTRYIVIWNIISIKNTTISYEIHIGLYIKPASVKLVLKYYSMSRSLESSLVKQFDRVENIQSLYIIYPLHLLKLIPPHTINS